MFSKKTLFVRIPLLLGTIVSLFYVPWPIVFAWLAPLPNTIQEQVNDALNNGFDGIVVYVDEAGNAPAYYTAGWHDSEDKIPAKSDALFKIASISKLYVAVAITKLVQDDRLSLDITLAEYFPELEKRIQYADEITLRMIVQHRSGIPNFTDIEEFWTNPPETQEQTLEIVLDLPANFKPNKKYGYSNTNYLLLKRLMDKELGYDHFQFIQDEILFPLALNDTYSSLHQVPIEKVMSGYHVGHEPDLKTADYGMVATAQDVGNFIRALNDGSVFKEGEQEIYSSIYVYDHTGLAPGYQSIAKYHKDIDTVVIQFTNTTDFEGYNWNLSEIVYGRILKLIRRKIKSK